MANWVEIPIPHGAVQDTAGNLLVNVPVTLTIKGTSTPVTHASNDAGAGQTTGGLVTRSDGSIGTVGARRRVLSGQPLIMDVTVGAETQTWEIQPVSAAAEVSGPDLTAHIADTTAAHAGTAISFSPTGTVSSTTVQAAIAEVALESGAPSSAGAVTFSPTGSIAATNVQAAVAEVSTETAADLAAHVSDTTAAHAATAISFTPAGSIAATTVQDAIAELDTDVDARLDLLEVATLNARTASYTLVIADQGKAVEMNLGTATLLTVPPNSSVAFPVGTVIEVSRMGAGTVTVAPGAGVTIRSADSLLALRAQYSVATLRKRATDEWVLAGDLA